MATHSSVLTWRIPGVEEPGGVYGVAQSQTRLKRLSSPSSRLVCSEVTGKNKYPSSLEGFPGGSVVKNPPSNTGDVGDMASSLGQEDPLEKEMATLQYSDLGNSMTEEPGGLQLMGLQKSQT